MISLDSKRCILFKCSFLRSKIYKTELCDMCYVNTIKNFINTNPLNNVSFSDVETALKYPPYSPQLTSIIAFIEKHEKSLVEIDRKLNEQNQQNLPEHQTSG